MGYNFNEDFPKAKYSPLLPSYNPRLNHYYCILKLLFYYLFMWLFLLLHMEFLKDKECIFITLGYSTLPDELEHTIIFYWIEWGNLPEDTTQLQCQRQYWNPDVGCYKTKDLSNILCYRNLYTAKEQGKFVFNSS